MNAGAVVQMLSQCLSSDSIQVKAGEEYISEASKQPEYIYSLLQIIEAIAVPTNIRQLASICFKNHIKRYWDVPDGIQLSDRNLIKERVLDLMIATSAEPSIQSQLSSAIELIALVDFPNDWKTLLPDIVKKHLLSKEEKDLRKRCASLEIADVVLQRYRKTDHSTDTLSELKFGVLPHIEEPILLVFQDSLRAILGFGSNPTVIPPELKESFNLLHHTVRIFHSLICVDLPEYLEDHKPIFFDGFREILKYSNNKLSARNNDTCIEGPLEEIKTEVCRILTLFAQRYTEEFEDHLEFCVVDVLVLLQTSKTSDQYMDGLASSAMKFLGAASKYRWTKDPFTQECIAAICKDVVVPNIRLRKSDLELLEENPIEFIRRALEGEEKDTRRGTAVELVQALSQVHESDVSNILPTYINLLLEGSKNATSHEDQQTYKDAAIYLVVAIVVKSQSRMFGVSAINNSIDYGKFFTTQLVNELRVPADAKISNVLVRAASLKFIATFRNQLEKDILLQLFPEIVKNLNVDNSIVHTHAAYCLEQLLLARQLPTENTAPSHSRGTLKFNKGELKEALLSSLEPLLKASTAQTGINENEYSMRCIMKVLAFLQEESRTSILHCLEVLRKLLEVQSAASNNPIFAHYLFESICTASRIAASLGQQATVESTLMPTLAPIVANGEHDFNPYALQVLGLLLDTASVASPVYIDLLNHLLVEQQWTTSTARVPAIIRVLGAFFRKQSIFSATLVTYLDVLYQRFQYCLNHKRLVDSAFQFIQDALRYIPVDQFAPYLQNIVFSLLKKLQSGQTTRLKHQVVTTLCIINCRAQCPPELPKILNAIQPGLLNNFVINIYVPTAKSMSSLHDKKVTLLGLARMCTSSDVQQDLSTLKTIINGCATLLGVVKEQVVTRSRPSMDGFSVDELDGLKPEQFEGSFNVLASANIPVASKEIPEVASNVLLQNVRACFDYKVLVEKLSNDPNWQQIVAFLSSI